MNRPSPLRRLALAVIAAAAGIACMPAQAQVKIRLKFAD